MKTLCRHLLAASLSSIALCQCQSLVEKPNYPIMDQKVVKVGDRTFVERRMMVNDTPPVETKRETIEVN